MPRKNAALSVVRRVRQKASMRPRPDAAEKHGHDVRVFKITIELQ